MAQEPERVAALIAGFAAGWVPACAAPRPSAVSSVSIAQRSRLSASPLTQLARRVRPPAKLRQPDGLAAPAQVVG
jgi:hypothetical protein